MNKLTNPFWQRILVLIVCLAAIAGLSGLSSNASYRVYFPDSDPLLQLHDKISELFQLNDQLVIIIQSPDARALEELPGILPATRQLIDTLKQIPSVTAVTSYEPLISDPDDIFASETTSPIDEKMASLLFSSNRQQGLIVLDVTLANASSAPAILNFNQRVKQAVDQSINTPLGTRSYFSGALALNAAYIDVVRHDLKIFFPGLIALMLLCLSLIFRRFSVALLLLGTGILATLAAFGVLGHLSSTLGAINAFVPVIIIALCIVTAMHNVLGYYRLRADGHTNSESLNISYAENLKPLTLSCSTTAIGFLFLATSPSPPIQLVGYSVAVGIVFSYLLILTWLRWALSKIDISSAEAQTVIHRFSLKSLRAFCLKQKQLILVVSLLSSLLAGVAISRLQVNDNFYQYFPEEHSFRQGLKVLDQSFAGAGKLNYVVNSNGNEGLTQQELQQLSHYLDWLKQQPEVNQILTIPLTMLNLDSLSWFKQNFSYALPELRRLLTDDQKKLRIELHINAMSAGEILAFDRKNKIWQSENISGLSITGAASADMMFASLSYRNANNMFTSLIIALLLITLLIGVLLRSVTAVFLALISNFLPVLLVYGFWTAVGGYISLGSAVVMGMILGIIVDDTLHILIKYQRSHQNHSFEDAQRLIWQQVMPAVVLSSLVLMVALLVGLLSDFRPITELSFLSILTICAALLADLLLLPALLSYTKIRKFF